MTYRSRQAAARACVRGAALESLDESHAATAAGAGRRLLGFACRTVVGIALHRRERLRHVEQLPAQRELLGTVSIGEQT